PSRASPASTVSENPNAGASPRVLTYSMLADPLLPDKCCCKRCFLCATSVAFLPPGCYRTPALPEGRALHAVSCLQRSLFCRCCNCRLHAGRRRLSIQRPHVGHGGRQAGGQAPGSRKGHGEF